MIDTLFGSKTRVKLLHLFLNNPSRSFYVREITRLIDEQINSVRRELANMLDVGIIVSDSVENKLYYEVNRQYEHYEPLRQIFGASASSKKPAGRKTEIVAWKNDIERLPGLRAAIAAGTLIRGSASPVDLLLVGSMPDRRVSAVVKKIEKQEGREIKYTVMTYDEFYYRLSVRDKFITEILSSACSILVDTENIIRQEGEKIHV